MMLDEETRYALELEQASGERQELELKRSELRRWVHAQMWPHIHQLRFANPWIKGMHVKLHFIRRPGQAVLSLRGEIESVDLRKRLTASVATQVLACQQSEAALRTHLQERERLFGSMLLAESVVRHARQPFLNGDFLGCLRAAYRIFTSRLEQLLGVAPDDLADVEALLTQDPPRLLLPDLSGKRLRRELDGVAKLISGVTLLLGPHLSASAEAFTDPAPVLKHLVLISLLIERLESATPNPTVGAGRARPHKAVRVRRPAPSRRPAAKRPSLSRSRRGSKQKGAARRRSGRRKAARRHGR